MRDTILDLVTGSVMGVVIWFGVPVLLRTFWKEANRATRGWLIGAIAGILLSYFLPSPWLTAHTETFSQHFVGGGVASALIAYYLIGHFELPRLFHRGLVVLSLVSVLGVANEMFELTVDVIFGTGVVVDASWDLFANTAGAAFAFLVVEAVRRYRSGESPTVSEQR